MKLETEKNRIPDSNDLNYRTHKNQVKLIRLQGEILKLYRYMSKIQFEEILTNRPTVPHLSNYTITTKKSPKAAQKTR